MRILEFMKKQFTNKRGFSLAENLTVIAILGLLAAILIPAMMNSRNTAKDRVAVRKAVTTFQGILEKGLVTQTGLTNNVTLQTRIFGANCTDIEDFFAVESHNNCYFTTKDGIQWFIAPTYALIKLKGVNTDLNSETLASINALARNNNNLKAFHITYSITADRQIQMFTNVGGTNPAKTRNFIMGN